MNQFASHLTDKVLESKPGFASADFPNELEAQIELADLIVNGVGEKLKDWGEIKSADDVIERWHSGENRWFNGRYLIWLQLLHWNVITQEDFPDRYFLDSYSKEMGLSYGKFPKFMGDAFRDRGYVAPFFEPEIVIESQK